MLLQLENATLRYDSKPLFKDANLLLNEGDRVGLVGDNGCGKTSLLRCIMGEERLNSGKILISRGVRKIGYVPQTLPTNLGNRVLYDYLLTALPKEERDYSYWKVDATLDELGVPCELRDKKLVHLSGGWQRFALIAYASLAEPDLLLFDEPTNYLDLGKIFRLEKWFNEVVKVPYIVVSHDRTFLDNCTKKTIHLRDGKLIFHNLPYTRSREALLNEDLSAARARQLEEKEIARIRAAAKRIHIWSNGRNPDMERRSKAIAHTADRLEAKKTEVYIAPKREISFIQENIRSNILLTVQNISVNSPDGKQLFRIPELYIGRGDRVALLGMNGAGKTQLLKMLVRAMNNPVSDHQAQVALKFNPQVRLGYFDQHMSNIPTNISVSDYITEIVGSSQDAIKQLVVAGFPYDKQRVSIGTLSQGEKARLAFLGLKLGRYNFFIMDEPTNHIDLDGQEKFEDALIDQAHTCLFVSHDRYMVDNIATRYLQIENGVLKEISSSDLKRFYQQIISGQIEPQKNDESVIKKGRERNRGIEL